MPLPRYSFPPLELVLPPSRFQEPLRLMGTCYDNALRLSRWLRRETLGVVQRLHLRVSLLAPGAPRVSRDDAITRTDS